MFSYGTVDTFTGFDGEVVGLKPPQSWLPLATSMVFHPSCVLSPQLLSRGSMDVPMLLAEVT
jgi:hypothetical protein